MIQKIVLAAIVAMAAILCAAPALAELGYGLGDMGCSTCGAGGYGMANTCGGDVAYGAPQDCMATVSCNIPVTQQVPYMTSTCEMQTVSTPILVPQQSTVTVPKTVTVPEQVTITVPKEVCVEEQVPVTTYCMSSQETQVPVQVPTVAYQPVTTMMPQTKTFCLGDNMPAGGTCGTGATGAATAGAGYGASAPAKMPAGTTAANIGANLPASTAGTGFAANQPATGSNLY